MQHSDSHRAPSARFPIAAAIVSIACIFAFGTGNAHAEPTKEIVLIGGPKSHGIGEHDFRNGIALIKELLEGSPSTRGAKITAYPDGWPADRAALDGASALVFYFDGAQGGPNSHPLADPARLGQLENLAAHGVGIVALHQASTVPANDTTINLPRWLGGARYGLFDRSEETVSLRPAFHPIANGVGNFELTDEFYPTIRFVKERKGVTPVLTARLHPQFRNGKFLLIDKPETHPVAWAFERADGGRSFTFTGLHYLNNLDNPPLRKLLLNAILWSAQLEVPKEGVTTTAPPDAAQRIVNQEIERATRLEKTTGHAVVRRSAENKTIEYPWGQLTWYASRELRNSETMTVGQAIIKPGQENPRHFHPNCDEVLHVLEGRILNTMGDESTEMSEGDTVSIPAGIHHNAKNIGKEDAILSLSYSSPDRQVVGE